MYRFLAPNLTQNLMLRGKGLVVFFESNISFYLRIFIFLSLSEYFYRCRWIFVHLFQTEITLIKKNRILSIPLQWTTFLFCLLPFPHLSSPHSNLSAFNSVTLSFDSWNCNLITILQFPLLLLIENYLSISLGSFYSHQIPFLNICQCINAKVETMFHSPSMHLKVTFS